MKKKKKKHNGSPYKKVIIVSVTSLLILIVFSIGFIFFLAQTISGIGEMFGNACDPTYPHSFEGYARVELPPSYDNFDSVCGGMQGQYFETTFTINPSELDLFLSATIIEQPLSSEMPSYTQSTYWHILETPPTSVLYGKMWASDDWLEEIIVDTSDDEIWIVYFTVLAG